MKYIKKFENINELPNIGDYILIHSTAADVNVRNFVNNTIGVVVGINYSKPGKWGHTSEEQIVVKYENAPAEIQSYFRKPSKITSNYKNEFLRNYYPEQIVEYGKTKEEVELKIASNKYGL